MAKSSEAKKLNKIAF